MRYNAKTKTPNTGKTICLKSGSQKRKWKYEPDALDKIIEEFYATVPTKDGDDYERDSFHMIVTAVVRYLTERK